MTTRIISGLSGSNWLSIIDDVAVNNVGGYIVHPHGDSETDGGNQTYNPVNITWNARGGILSTFSAHQAEKYRNYKRKAEIYTHKGRKSGIIDELRISDEALIWSEVPVRTVKIYDGAYIGPTDKVVFHGKKMLVAGRPEVEKERSIGGSNTPYMIGRFYKTGGFFGFGEEYVLGITGAYYAINRKNEVVLLTYSMEIELGKPDKPDEVFKKIWEAMREFNESSTTTQENIRAYFTGKLGIVETPQKNK